MNRKGPKLPWYDARWLGMYCAAKAYMRNRGPERLATFERALEPLRTRASFETCFIRGLLDDTQIERCRAEIRRLGDTDLDKRELFRFGRQIADKLPLFTELGADLAPLVSDKAGEKVEPTYNFLSLYNNLGKCELHLDSPYSKWTLDICIDQSGEWPIFISDVIEWPEHLVTKPGYSAQSALHDSRLKFRAFHARPGDAILFSGSSQWHYRERIPVTGPANYAHLVFLHYVPAGMLELAAPENWARQFDEPGLEPLVGSCASSIVNSYSELKHILSTPKKE